jgi:DNA-binding NtrC family response regulator
MKKILILDDEDRIRRIYKELLVNEGYEIIEASTALEAHATLKSSDIDLILLDIRIPKVSGSVMYDVIEQFFKELKVIVSSVYPIDLQKRIIPGAYDYYDKSQGTELLLQKVKKALEN